MIVRIATFVHCNLQLPESTLLKVGRFIDDIIRGTIS